MSTLMCDYIHVTTGSVKVCKNKRYTIIRKLRHATTGSLILTSEYIKSSFSIIMLKKSLVSSDISVYICGRSQRISSGSTDRRRISLGNKHPYHNNECVYPKDVRRILVHSGS